MFVYVSCGMYDKVVSLLNNLRRVDLAALVLESCLEARVTPSSPKALEAESAVYLSFARHLQAMGLNDMAAYYCTARAGEDVAVLKAT